MGERGTHPPALLKGTPILRSPAGIPPPDGGRMCAHISLVALGHFRTPMTVIEERNDSRDTAMPCSAYLNSVLAILALNIHAHTNGTTDAWQKSMS